MGDIGVLVIELQAQMRRGLLALVGSEDLHGQFLQRCNRGVRSEYSDQIPSRRNYVLRLLFQRQIVSH